MIILNKGINTDSARFNTNLVETSNYYTLKFIPNPATYENISEDMPAYRVQNEFFEAYPQIRQVLMNYFLWSVDNLNFFPLDPIDMLVKDGDREIYLTLHDCVNRRDVIIKPIDDMLLQLYNTYKVPQEYRVSWDFNRDIPSYSFKMLMQFMCNPIVVTRPTLTMDEISFYKVWGGGLRG